MKPLVSVVIPTYNRSDLLECAINSALGQSVRNIEIIVCDDGSTDNTLPIITRLKEIDDRVKYLKLIHTSLPSVARNAGIKAASGEWIAFLDSDDKWQTNKLEIQLKTAQKINASMLCSNAYINTGNKYFSSSKSRNITIEELLDENCVITSSVLVKKRVLVNVGLFSENRNLQAIEDYELWLKIATTYAIYYSKECLASYTTNSDDSIRRAYSDLDLIKKSVYAEFMREAPLHKLKIDNNLFSKLKSFVDKPTISVLMPVKDVKLEYLLQSVNSILSQTFSDFELIIIDDGSKISVNKMLMKLKDPRIKIFRNITSRGISRSLNTGIAKAKGRYIARMDADDIAKEHRIKEQKDYLDNHTSINVLGSWSEVFGEANYLRKTMSNPEDISLEMLFRCPIAHPTVMLRSSFIRAQSHIYNSAYDNAEDYELWTRFIGSKTITNIDQPLLEYRTHSGQIGKTNEVIQNTTSDKIRRNLLREFIPNISEKEIEIHNNIAKYSISTSDSPLELARCLVKVVFDGSHSFGISKSSKVKRVMLESYPIFTKLNYFNKLVYAVLVLYFLSKRTLYAQ